MTKRRHGPEAELNAIFASRREDFMNGSAISFIEGTGTDKFPDTLLQQFDKHLDNGRSLNDFLVKEWTKSGDTLMMSQFLPAWFAFGDQLNHQLAVSRFTAFGDWQMTALTHT